MKCSSRNVTERVRGVASQDIGPGDAIPNLDLSDGRFSVQVKFNDPQDAWMIARAMAPTGWGQQEMIECAPIDEWESNWPDNQAFVISNDTTCRNLWAVYRSGNDYSLIVLEYTR